MGMFSSQCNDFILINIKVVSGVLITFKRPNTAPFSLLILYVSILVSQLIVLAHTRSSWHPVDVLAILGPVTAFSGSVIILCMPMRDPELPSDEICPAFQPPNPKLRSPEDNLTPWQFMTVSWMAPLISIGAKRQLNDEDVWRLAYEFQHRRLHDAFRELYGSVVRRLLQANWFDLMLTSILGVIELLASTNGVNSPCTLPLAKFKIRSFNPSSVAATTSLYGKPRFLQRHIGYVCCHVIGCAPCGSPILSVFFMVQQACL